MTHDPFDRLRGANPVPDESLPPAPMATADRIIGGRGATAPGRWPGWAVATAAAAAVLMVGGGWMLWLGRTGDTTAADPGVTFPVASATTDATPVTPLIETTAYLLNATGTGPVLVPVPRSISAPDDATAALDALLDGPTTAEETAGLYSSMPQADWLSIARIDGGTAVVRVSDALLAARYEALPPEALAQIVFTLTRLDGIDGVEFLLGDGEGTPGGVVAGTLQLVPQAEFTDYPFVDFPATRMTFEGFMPLAFVEAPSYDAFVTLPYAARGVANSIGNQVRLTLAGSDGATLWQDTVLATCGTPWSECRGESDWSIWEASIPSLDYTGYATLTAESFGSGVEIIDRRTYPLTIAPVGEAPSTTTTTMVAAGPAVPEELAVYLFMDSDSTFFVPGPYLVPAAWTTAVLSAPLTDPARQAMEWLLQGPLPGWAESIPAISTAIPAGTRLLGLEVADGIATVDLSGEFVSGGGSFSMRARLAQVVFTLTRFEDIDGVRFLVDGVPTTVFGGEGVIIDDPATREGFDDLLPAVMIETPMYGGSETGNPLVVSGTANVFEATVSLALVNNDGLILWEGFATATCGTGCRGDWSIEIPYSLPTDQLGAVIAWESSAQDGSQTNVREHPVWLTGADRPAEACSGGRVPDGLPEVAGLPAEASATRDALFAAARTCDWEALSSLLGPDTNTAFGTPQDPIQQWQ
ncbi:MAG: GerMN domain-containing protein, partial [Actinobacteria bacterium]|nr:GerMN domain-containing protein [Actinomycetota bacterium]